MKKKDDEVENSVLNLDAWNDVWDELTNTHKPHREGHMIVNELDDYKDI
jgi:hypothetical protein